MKLILGINPLLISHIDAIGGTRNLRKGQQEYHPYYNFLRRKKWWLNTTLDFSFPWNPATVRIFGSGGKALKVIHCRSNKAAMELRNSLQEEWLVAIDETIRDMRKEVGG